MPSRLSALIESLASLWRCFPPEESTRLHEVLALTQQLEPERTSELEEAFRHAQESLPLVASAMQACPILYEFETKGIAGRERNEASLIDNLCQEGERCLEFAMPMGAIYGRAFVLGKLNFLKHLGYILERAGARASEATTHVKDMISDTIFSKLAEEILTGAVSNPRNSEELKRAAVGKLLGMWNSRLQLPVGEFPPVLLSAWRARVKVREIYGTMMGVNEILGLMSSVDVRFVSYFSRDDATTDEKEAFREFLFGLSYEELQRIDAHMKANDLKLITRQQVREILGNRPYAPYFGDPSAEQIYNSYLRRRLRADYRAMMKAPGPWKTAEGYIMEALLRDEARGAGKRG